MTGIRWAIIATTLVCLLLAIGCRHADAAQAAHHQENRRDSIIFADLGVLFRTHATVHASINVNLTYLVDHCQALQDQHTLTPTTNNHFRSVQRLLTQVCSNIGDLGMEVDVQRKKRQILAAIALGFTSVFGLYNAAQIHRIDHQIEDLGAAQLRRDAILVHNSNRLQQVETSLNEQREAINTALGAEQQLRKELDDHTWVMETMAHVQELAYFSNQITQGIQAAYQGHLTTAILSKKDASFLMRKIRRLANELGGMPIITSREDLYRLPVTIATIGPHHLRLLLHTGVSRDPLRLYRYRPTPIVIHDHTGETTIIISPARTLLAHNDRLHQELDETDLASCTRRGNTYVCQGPSVFHTQLRKTCLGALFAGDLEQVHARCPVTTTNTTWAVESMANNKVATYFRDRTTLQLSCEGQERQNSYARGSQLITIPTNCSLLGDDLQVDSHSDILLEAPTTTYPFWNTSEFLRGQTPRGITDIKTALRHSNIRPATSIEDLMGQDQQLQETLWHHRQGVHLFSLFYVSLGFNLLVIITLCGRCGYLWRQHLRLPSSTSPTEDVVLAKMGPIADTTTN